MIIDDECKFMTDNKTMATGLRCEYLVDPVGIDTDRPRFSWKIFREGRGVRQNAFQVIVASSKALVDNNSGDMWDSGLVETDRQLSVEYNGKKLESKKAYYWKVRVSDELGELGAYSQAACYETAFLSEDEWKADWIACAATKPYPIAPMFRKEFELERKVKSARTYISGIGYYELFLNGNRVGKHVLDPAFTDYTKRVMYSTYDVTDLVKSGLNAVGVILGIGWYSNPPQSVVFQSIPQLILQMHIKYTDGSENVVVSGANCGWQTTSDGPIVFNTIYDGETYDSRLEIKGWNLPGFKTATKYSGTWKDPLVVESPGGKLVAQHMEPIKVISDIKPKSISNPAEGIYVYDFGQNFAGWVKLKARGPRSTAIVMKFAEMLYDDGTVNRENLRTANATDTFILKGEGEEVFEPSFTYHGFRYVQVERFPGKPSLENVTGRIVRSSVEVAGSFNCSNDLINQIHKNIVWTEASNIHGLPTDCPQRDERLGWLNDVTVRSEEAVHNFYLASLYAKWENDIADTQGNDTGAIADTAPYIKYGRRPADPVASSYLIVPWLLYLHYGDTRTISNHYEGMKRWVGYLSSISKGSIVYYSEIGDWAPPITEAVEGSIGAGAVSAKTPGALISSGFYYYNTVLMSKFACLLGKSDEAKWYSNLAVEIKEAINEKFLDKGKGQYGSGNQSSNVFPLYLGIVPEEYKKAVFENLVNDIIKNEYHVTTGNLCTKYLIDVLTDRGRSDVAFALLTQTTYPSWGYMISKGATTIWERWEHVTGGELAGMGSHNHPMYGAVDAWFYRYLAGIRTNENGPGYGEIIIKPTLVPGISFAEASVETVRGKVFCSWKLAEESLYIDVAVPCNASAVISIPRLTSISRQGSIHEDGRPIWDNGRFTANNEIAFIGENGESIVFGVGSGTYSFVVNA